MIPNIIHQIWIQGYDAIPPDLLEKHKKCKSVNHGFEFIVWDDGMIRELLKQMPEVLFAYQNFTVFAQKADIARYAILYIYGGIYLDVDMICMKNMGELLEIENVFITAYFMQKIYKRYHNFIIGATPFHPLFLLLLNNILQIKDKKIGVIKKTGPGILYVAVQEYKKLYPHNDVHVMNGKYFNPCNMHSDATCYKGCKDCYTIHTHYSSWSMWRGVFKSLCMGKKYVLGVALVVLLIILVCLSVRNLS